MTSKICFINSSKIWGGGESWQLETMLDFKERVSVISLSSPKGTLYQKAFETGIKTVAITVGNLSFLNPFKVLKAYLLLKKLAPHAIMFNTANDYKLFTLPAKWAGIKYRLYRRDNGKAMKNHLLNRVLLGNGISHFLPCSNFIKSAALSKNPKLIPADKIDVIYNSINLTKWDQLTYKPIDFKRNSDEVVFGCIGRLSNEKGQLFLPETALLLSQKHTNFKILLAGTGPIKDELEQLIEKKDVDQFVKLLGFVESNKAFIDTLDCLIIPSYWEGLSTVAIEAMALNKPVIAFDVAGNPEVVINCSTGFLVKPFILESLSEQMAKMIESPELMASMGEKGRQLAVTTLSREVTNKQLEKYFL